MSGRNGDTYCMYVTEQGGIFKTIPCSKDEYERWKADRLITYQGDRDGEPYTYRPYYMAFVRAEDNFDFALGSSRDALAAA